MMAHCERFETEFLPDLEATGQVQHTHVQRCSDCSASYQSYRSLIAALRVEQAAPALPGDWQARVLAQVRTRGAATPPSRQVGAAVSRARLLWYLVPPLAAAAAALLILSVPGTQLAPLPDYAFALEGGERVIRNGSNAPRFRPGTAFEVLLRPGHTVEEAVGARVFVLGTQPLELHVEVVQLSKGVLKVKAVVPRPAAAGSEYVRIAVVVGRSRPLAQHSHEWLLAAADGGDDWRRFTITLELARSSEVEK